MPYHLPKQLKALLTLTLCLLLLSPFSTFAENPNRLQAEQSPYLQQHAHNPVDWFPWGEEAFAKAKKEGKLIFLSIGYSTCHWCHVMEAESFADREVAALLNRDYVAIKVDREERPDIDQFYMQVCTEMTGSGGWPLTIIMTADKIPIFSGTYFPKQRRHNRPGMLELLPQVVKLWRDNPDYLLNNAQRVLEQLQKKQATTDSSKQLGKIHIDHAVAELKRSFDNDKGGFGSAPKFPRPHLLSFLLLRHYREQNPALLQMVEKTLQAMRHGGIYDQIGFGFHRYSTDADWLVPHFEKMLYDQAGLARVYLEAFQLTGKREYASTAREVFAYLQQNLRDPAGGFYTAEDADSEGVEGKFYLWQSKQIDKLLGPERAKRFKQIFNVDPFGNFAAFIPDEEPGTNILHLQKPLSAWAVELKIPLDKLRSQLEEDRLKLFAAREQRVHPFRDDKVLSGWNGLTISALALGARVLNDPALLQQAETAARFIEQQMQTADGHLLRRWRSGKAEINAFASDYAFVARGLLDLYRSSYKPKYLQQAIAFGEILRDEFSDQHGQLFETVATNELPLRTRELYDGALPSSGSVALELYARLYLLTGDKAWSQSADALLKASAGQVIRYPAGYTQLLFAASLLLEPTRELVIVGDPERNETKELLAMVQTQYRPETSILLRSPEDLALLDRLAPYAAEMKQIDKQATAYLCQNFACQRPQTEPLALQKLLLQTEQRNR